MIAAVDSTLRSAGSSHRGAGGDCSGSSHRGAGGDGGDVARGTTDALVRSGSRPARMGSPCPRRGGGHGLVVEMDPPLLPLLPPSAHGYPPRSRAALHQARGAPAILPHDHRLRCRRPPTWGCASRLLYFLHVFDRRIGAPAKPSHRRTLTVNRGVTLRSQTTRLAEAPLTETSRTTTLPDAPPTESSRTTTLPEAPLIGASRTTTLAKAPLLETSRTTTLAEAPLSDNVVGRSASISGAYRGPASARTPESQGGPKTCR